MVTSKSSFVSHIRRATVVDAAALADICAATFTETFGRLYPPEDLRHYLDAKCSAEACERVIEDERNAVWIVRLDSVPAPPIGFISVGPCKLPLTNLEEKAGEVKQLYLLSKFHNLRVGAQLMDTALEWLTAEHYTPIYVGVWSENFGAQRFYRRYGFEKVGEYGFPVGSTVDLEHILKRRSAGRP